MGNRIAPEPTIMTKCFLEEKIIQNMIITEDLDVSELQKLIETDGLEYDLIFSLNLVGQNLVNIDELWRFNFLTKLELSNNYLEKIEGLDKLINLQYLDLSFNLIKQICNLETLINLTTLNLTSNEISVLENMEQLKKLDTFLIRKNKIHSFDNIYYLKQFHNLTTLAVDRNPFMQETDVKFHIIAILPQLKYLDFILITSDLIQQASCKFPFEKDKGPHTEQTSIEKFTCGFSHSDKEADVEGLANGQGFQSMLLSDKNYRLLCSFPLAAEISQEIFDEWHKFGHEMYEQMQHEKSQFLLMVSKAKEFSIEVFQEEEFKFIDFKENIPKKLCYIYHGADADDEKIKKISDLKKTCDAFFQKTFRNFMNSSCLFVDLVINMCKTYEKEVNILNEKYVQKVSKFRCNIMDLNKKFSERLLKLYVDIHNSGPELSEVLLLNDKEKTSDDLLLLQLLKEKELIKITLELSVRIHSIMLKERINHLKINLHGNLKKTVDQVTEEAYFKQGEFIRNTVIFCNKQKFFIDKLFSKNNIFEQYFGYLQNLQ